MPPSSAPSPLDGLGAGWAEALEAVAPELEALRARLAEEATAGRAWLPAPEHVLRALEQPLDAVRVLVVGQDPYPTPGHPIGLAFAVDRRVRPVPRSLQNLYRELQDDLGLRPAGHGDLSAWTDQGVLLLNRVLTVRAGEAGSHRGWGWEAVTEAAIRALVARRDADGAPVPLVAMLWGAQAQSLAPLLEGAPGVAVLASAHPSPLSARRGFFGSRPFSRANAALEAMGARPVDWAIRDDPEAPALLDVGA